MMIDLSVARDVVWSDPRRVAGPIAFAVLAGLLAGLLAGCAPTTSTPAMPSRTQAVSTTDSAEVTSSDMTASSSQVLSSSNSPGEPAVTDSLSGSAAVLRVEASGARSQQGHYAFAVYANQEDFVSRSNPVVKGRVAADADSVIWDAGEVPSGEYAIAVYHDANDNQQLDRHAFGYPLEAYGFSRDARGKLGPPAFRDAAFKIDNESLQMRIRIK